MLNTKKAFSTVEALLAVSLFGLLVTAMVGGIIYGREATAVSGNAYRAQLMAEEGLEASRNLRDNAFANLVDGDHGLSNSGNVWSYSGSSDTSGVYTRVINIASVDANRKTVTSTVTWQQTPSRQGSVTLSTRLTNWLVPAGGGGGGGGGLWTNPAQEANLDAAGTVDGLKVRISGNYAYVVRADATPDFLVVDLTTPSAPTLAASLNLAGSPTNIHISGNYAFVTSTDDSAEMQVIDISNPLAPSVVATYNAPGANDANGIFISSNTAYIVRSSAATDELIVLNVTSPTLPVPLGTLDLSATGYEVAVSGNYAYIASGSNSQELQVVNVTNPLAPSIVGSLNLSGNTDAITVAVNGSTALLGQGNNINTINITTPTAPTLLGSYNTSGTVADIGINFTSPDNYVFLATSANSAEFQVINISNLAAPTLAGSVNVAGNNQLNGIAYDQTLDRAVGVGVSDTEEVIVFKPQ